MRRAVALRKSSRNFERSCRQRLHNFRSGDGLPNMALRVIGAVDQQSRNRRRQAIPANGTRLLPIRHRNRQDARCRRLQTPVELREQRIACARPGVFRAEGPALCFAERMAFRIGQQTIQAARYMQQVEGNRRQLERTSVNLRRGQRSAPAGDVLARQLQRMEYGALRGRMVRQRSARPKVTGWRRPERFPSRAPR
jgi:hypothetical protein